MCRKDNVCDFVTNVISQNNNCVTFQETSRPSRSVTSVPVSLWRMGRPDSPPSVAPPGQNCASSRVSLITLNTLWWAWSTTPTSGRSHVSRLYFIWVYPSQSSPGFEVVLSKLFAKKCNCCFLSRVCHSTDRRMWLKRDNIVILIRVTSWINP